MINKFLLLLSILLLTGCPLAKAPSMDSDLQETLREAGHLGQSPSPVPVWRQSAAPQHGARLVAHPSKVEQIHVQKQSVKQQYSAKQQSAKRLQRPMPVFKPIAGSASKKGAAPLAKIQPAKAWPRATRRRSDRYKMDTTKALKTFVAKNIKSVAKPKVAKKPARSAAERQREQALALAKLGDRYLDGVAVKQDVKLALSFYRRAAKHRSVYAQMMVGLFYQKGIGVTPNPSLAQQWLARASRQPERVSAEVQVAKRFEQENSALHDLPAAAMWYRLAANQGSVVAQNRLGDMYLEGRGVPVSDISALNWYGKAAAQGSSYAQYSLGALFYGGGAKVEQSYLRASEWFRKAAQQGFAEAQYALARMYHEGLGVTRDNKKAYAWLMVARTHIATGAAPDALLSTLTRNMTPQQLTDSAKLARQYRLRFG